mgnify:CR=1 FL=1
MPSLVIGDIHGCYDELLALLDKAALGADDEIIAIGDMVDRGPKSAQVLDTEDVPIPGLYAAGELVGGLFWHNYPGGTGLTNGAVFGRIAGASAAR